MAGFGGAVKLTGEAEYRKALSMINTSLREMSSEMKVVQQANEKGEKSNKDLRKEKELLNEALEKQKDHLKEVSEKLKKFGQDVDNNRKEHQRLVDTYNVEKARLEEIKNRSGEASQEYKDQEKKVLDLGNQVEKSNKILANSEIEYSKLKTQVNNATVEIGKSEDAIENLGKEEKNNHAIVEKLSGGYSVFKGILADLGSKVISSAITGLKNLGKSSLEEYAKYEQLVGGIETLFKGAEEEALQYAKDGWKTAGVSANTYMEQITGFSATLIQGLNGDTKKAVEYGNMAIVDMSDNANKMGTNIASIQNAYQGFAKNNYTMLDNLKLGYGGTAGEMARLINDSGVLGDSVKVTAKNVKDVPFDKVIEAIHEIQKGLDITGTTVKEASGTIEGSQIKLKASWDNLKVGIADDTADIDELVKNMTGSVVDYIKNVGPRIKTIVKGLGQTGKSLIQEISNIVDDEALNSITELLTDIMGTISDSAPQLLEMGTKLVTSLARGITKNAPAIAESGMKMATTLLKGIADVLPSLVTEFAKEIPSIMNVLFTTVGATIQNLVQEFATGVLGMEMTYIDTINSIQANIDAKNKEIADYISTLNSTKGDIVDYNKILDAQGRTIGDIEKDYSDTESKVTQILSTALKEQRDLRDDELKAIEEYNEKLAELNGAKLDIYLRQQKAQLMSLQAQLDNLSEEELYKFLANQEEAMNESKALIDRDYADKLVDLQNYYSARGMLDSEEYQRALEDAKREMENQKAVAESYYKSTLAMITEEMTERVDIESSAWEELKKKNSEYTDAEMTNAEKVAGAWASQKYENIQNKESYISNMDEVIEKNGDVTGAFFDMVTKTKLAGNELDDTTKDSVNAVLNNFDGLPGYLEEDGKDILLGLIKGMEGQIDGLDNVSEMSAQDIVDTIRDFLDINSPSRVMEEIGEYTIEGLTEGMAKKESHIKNEMFSIASIILAESGKITSDAFKSGQNVADGIWKGMKEKEPTLLKNVKNMMNNIVRSVNDALDIHSPSRVFAQIGTYMAEGLDEGFSRTMGDVSRDIAGQIPSSVNDLGIRNNGGSFTTGGKYEMNVYVQEMTSAQREALFNEFDRFAGGRI